MVHCVYKVCTLIFKCQGRQLAAWHCWSEGAQRFVNLDGWPSQKLSPGSLGIDASAHY